MNQRRIHWGGEENAVPLTKFYSLFLSLSTTKLLFLFLSVTGFHDLLSFISISFSKSSAEPLAKRGRPPSRSTHTLQTAGSERIAKSLPPNRSPLGSEGRELLRFLSKQEWLSLENLKVLYRKASDARVSRLRASFCTALCPTKSTLPG